MEDKYVKWFNQSVRNILDNIMAQKVYLGEVAEPKVKPERVILGKKVYDMLSEVINLEDNMLYDMHIAIDCEDDCLIAVCHGSKANARDCLAELED